MTSAAVAEDAHFVVHPDRPQQVVWGMGFEIQSDSIASGNQGISDSTTSVPHDLVPAERDRLADEMLKGFRFCRLAGGLYWRGLDNDQKRLRPRWPDQLKELKALLDRAGVESLSFEYWSPAPFWKANRSYVPLNGDASQNVLRCYGPDFANDPDYHGDTQRFLSDFADAVCTDLHTLETAGLKVGFFGLQNEPGVSEPYPSCVYTPDNYAKTFRVVAPTVRARHPSVKIISDTDVRDIRYAARVMKDPDTAGLVDYLVMHSVGSDSKTVADDLAKVRAKISQPLPLYQNEYEYLKGPTSPERCVNTVQNIMNWYQIAGSPTWYWIHCLKPFGNSEASGYSLGFWKPLNPSGQAAAPADVLPGHFVWNNYNWFSVVGFLKHMPWDSTVVKIDEARAGDDRRLLAYKRPDGRLVLVVSNRTGSPVTFKIDTGLNKSFAGYRYTPDDAGPHFMGRLVGTSEGKTLSPTVPNLSWEFWVEQP